jgi:hypothetical protein
MDASRTTPLTVEGRKPSFSNLTVYVPTGNCGTVNSPAAFEGRVKVTPVWVLVRVTLAPGMTAPVASNTVPLIIPRSD